MRLPTTTAIVLTCVVVLAACASDDGTAGDLTTIDGTAPATPPVVAGEALADERCAANRAAGPITFLTGFDFAAAASTVEVIVADANGYYDELCLDVEITPSFSTANYALIAENDAQFASGGSFSEVVAFAAANEADFIVTSVAGPTAIDALIVKPGVAAELGDLEGSTIGVKGKLPPSVAAMLATAGLIENEHYETVLLDGFDPAAHIAIESIDGFPGWKSNEPGALERAGIDVDLFDPLDYDIPGSFGVIYTSREFADAHPSAAEDFMRATMMGLADALADPDAAANAAVNLINSGGNPNFLSPEGEIFRWTTDATLITDLTPADSGVGIPDPDALQNELDTYAEVGLFGDRDTPDASTYLSDVLEGLYDGSTVIWPAAS